MSDLEFNLDAPLTTDGANQAAGNPAPDPTAGPSQQGQAQDAKAGSDVQGGAGAQPSEPERIPVSALQEERRKRQEAQQELARVRGQLDVYQQQNAPVSQQAVETPDEFNERLFADPHGTIKELLVNERRAWEAMAWDQHLSRSARAARQRYKDFDDAVGVFRAAAENGQPWLLQQIKQEHDPAEFAYQWAKSQEVLSKYGSTPDAMRAKLKEELKAEILAEQQKAAQTAAQLPEPQAGSRSAGSSAASPIYEDTPLDQLGGGLDKY